MPEFIKAVTSADFEKEVIEQSKTTPVLIDFWAQWCGPCKQLMPMLHSIVESLNGAVYLATVDTDAEQELSMNFGIRSLPTVLLMKDGEIVEQFMGVKAESEIRQLLESHISQNEKIEENQDDNLLDKAVELISNQEVDKAILLLQEDPNSQSKLLLIKVYLQEGKLDEAQQTFANLSDDEQQSDEAKIIQTTLLLIKQATDSDDLELQKAVEVTISQDPRTGINQMLGILSKSSSDTQSPIKQCLILAFNLIDDAKLVSQLRRKMAALIF